MKLRLNHVSLRVTDLDRARAFYTGVLGLAPHPQKTNWLGAGQGCFIHLMTPALDDAGPTQPTDPARHVALEVASLEEAVAALLKGGARPYQATVDQKSFRAIASADQPLICASARCSCATPTTMSSRSSSAAAGFWGI